MKIVGHAQGTPEWHAHRRTTRNASDAPVMMGVSPYVTRSELIRQRATGVQREIDEATQYIFDKGHAVEPLLRALAETYTGQEFYPITAASDDGYLSASFDGVSMDETALCEAKQSNAEKMQQARDGVIPPADRWQVVQQFAVCETATRCLYVIGDGTEEGSVILTIPRSEVEADIPKLLAGWAQFDADVAAYVPEAEVVPPAVGAPVETIGALVLRVDGRVSVTSNMEVFRAGAEAFIARLPKPENLQTDQDFADAEIAVKVCADAEANIKAAKAAVMAQMADVEAVMITADTVNEAVRQARLALERALKSQKELRKSQIVTTGAAAVRAHYDAINATLGAHAFQPPQTLQLNLGSVIKGLRSIKAMRDAVDTAVAAEKIEASQRAERVRACIAILQEHANENRHLFADAVQLCATKQPDDLRNLVAARVAEHQREQAERLEAERAKIRQEEADRLEREQKERERQQANQTVEATPAPATPAPAPVVEQKAANTQYRMPATAAPAAVVRIKLGDINARIAPMTITADGLAQLGINSVGTERSAKLYDAADFPTICTKLHAVLTRAESAQAA